MEAWATANPWQATILGVAAIAAFAYIVRGSQ